MRFCWDPPTETRVHWEKKGGKCMGNNIISKVLKFVGIGVIIVGIAASLISGGSVNTFSYE